jgi:polyhydroxyalkanoate synthesis regulator phasin
VRKRRYIFEHEFSYTKEERKAFIDSLKQFSKFKNEIYRSKRLVEISEQLGQMIESAEAFTLKETEGMFDAISVGRDMKSIKDDYKLFSKTCAELTKLQQRLESLYENIGTKLGRYYDL